MMDEALYEKLNALREEYRGQMNGATSRAERKQEAFAALNRAIKIIEADANEARLDGLETVTPAGLRVRADLVRHALNDSGSCARHLELAADEIERLAALTAGERGTS